MRSASHCELAITDSALTNARCLHHVQAGVERDAPPSSVQGKLVFVGHYASGDWGFEYRTFGELAYLAGPPSVGGVGIGENGVELRWVLLDNDGDAIHELFLTDLPAKLRAHFARYPQRNDDLRWPMPCRLEELATMVLTDAKKVAPALREATKGCIEVEIALTPIYRLRVAELDEALAILAAALPAKLRKRLTRKALMAEKKRNERSEIPETPLIETLSDALRGNGPTFLLHAVTWLLWHEGEHEWGDEEPAMVVTDDATLYQRSLRAEVSLHHPKPEGDPKRCAAQVAGWAQTIQEDDASAAVMLEGRLEALLWATAFPATHRMVGDALVASAHVWGQLGDRARAIAELDWALLLRPDAHTYNSRGCHKHLAGNVEAAILDYTAALAKKRDPLFLLNRAEAHLDLGRRAECLRDALAALKLAPKDATARALVAKARA